MKIAILFPGPFERPNSGPDEVFPECADDGDLSDCSPEDRAFFKFDPADVRHAGARGMLVYSNGAVVPVEGPALVVSFVNLVFFLKKKNSLRQMKVASLAQSGTCEEIGEPAGKAMRKA